MANLSLGAQRVLLSPCRAPFLGDSRVSDLGSTQLCTAVHKCIRPSWWSGWGGSGLQNGSSLSGGIWNFINHASLVARGIYYTPSGGAGDVPLWPCHFGDLPFAGDEAVDATLAVPYSDTTKTAEFYGGDWTANALTCKWGIYRSTGTTLGIANVGHYTRRIPDLGEGHYTGSVALSNGYNVLSQSLNAAASRCDYLLSAANPNIVETGKNIYIMGWRKYRDELGLQISWAGIGGSAVADHINTGYISDTAIAQYVSLYNVNTCFFMIGHNDPTINTTWRDNYAAWIQRWRAAVGSSFRAIIISDYQTSTNTAARVAQMEAYLAEIANGASDVHLVPFGSADNGYALNNSLLPDNVHFSAAGSVYAATMIQNLLAASLSGSSGVGGGIGSTRRSSWKRNQLTRLTRR